MEAAPPFDIAVDRFRAVLQGQGRQTNIRWRQPDDVLRLWDGRTIVRRRGPGAAVEWARRYFEAGRRRDVGIALDATCELDGSSCATLFWTDDPTEASYRLMPDRGLKLCVADPLKPGISVSGIRWSISLST